jgi:hypothetical protein
MPDFSSGSGSSTRVWTVLSPVPGSAGFLGHRSSCPPAPALAKTARTRRADSQWSIDSRVPADDLSMLAFMCARNVQR